MIKLLILIIFIIILAVIAQQALKRFVLWTERAPVEKPKPKAIDTDPNNVVGWDDIQWTVEKRLKDER